MLHLRLVSLLHLALNCITFTVGKLLHLGLALHLELIFITFVVGITFSVVITFSGDSCLSP